MSDHAPAPDAQLPPPPSPPPAAAADGPDNAAHGADNAAEQLPQAPPGKLTVLIQDGEGNRQHYQMKPTTKMSKVMDVFAENQGRQAKPFRFYTPDGVRILEHHTPETLEIEDGDVIDVQEEQLGGAGGFEDDSGDEDIQATPPKTAEAEAEGEAEGETEVQSQPEVLYIRVREHGGSELTFHIRPGTKMLKVMKAWCKASGKTEESVRFFTPDGKRINPPDTAESCDLVDGDLIDVQTQQTGGKTCEMLV